MQVDVLIKELLATGSMNEDTTGDLNRWLEESAAGTLQPEDAEYIAALHAKITGAPLSEPIETVAEPARLDGLSIEDWRERALQAEAELAALKDRIASTSA